MEARPPPPPPRASARALVSARPPDHDFRINPFYEAVLSHDSELGCNAGAGEETILRFLEAVGSGG